MNSNKIKKKIYNLTLKAITKYKKNNWPIFLKYLLFKVCIITNTFCLGFTFTTMTMPFWLDFIKMNNENNDLDSYYESILINRSDDITQSIKNNASEIAKNYIFDTNTLELENDSKKTNNISAVEYKEKLFQTDLDLILEIACMLEKYNMTYIELVELVLNNPEYNQELQNVLVSNPNLTTDKLIAILQGKDNSLRETLFIGDSRTKGMLLSGVIREDNSVYGVGYGYNWLIGKGEFSPNNTNALNGAIDDLKNKMVEGQFYNIVIWLGVNDYTYVDANTYFEKYKELALNDWNNHNIYIVSVGPVKENSKTNVSNIGIDNFNNSLKELTANTTLDNLNFIDLNLNENSIKNYDTVGLHYGPSDYQNIFNTLIKTITKMDTKDIHSLLNVFYNALNSYDKVFDNNDANEIILRRLRIHRK